jgi:LacI family transcriptional regulator
MYSMRDVARLAGVSVATVSAVINQKGTVSPISTERVERAMEALDYQPDQIARSLRVGHSKIIGMVVPDISNVYYAEVIRGVEEFSEQRGYSVIVCDSKDDTTRERRQMDMLYSRRVDGILLASSTSQAVSDLRLLQRTPIVFIDSVPAGIDSDAVIVDNSQAAYAATHHLITLGHRRIAIISGRLDRSVGVERMNGYQKAMHEAKLWTPNELIHLGDFHVESGYKSGLALMDLAVPPTAIFSCNNRMTLGLLQALGELKIDCPGRVSVICFDDADWATSFIPNLTCIAQPTHEIGKRATEMLLEKMAVGEKYTYRRCPIAILQAELQVRDSTAAPMELLAQTIDDMIV